MNPKEIIQNVVDLSMSAVEVSVSTTNILSGTRTVQDAATTMASAVEELAASIGVIEATSQHSSESINASSRLTAEGMRELNGLKQDISDTGRVFDLVSVKTKDLQDLVSNLSKVVDIISQIAGQTNLLALNATIEAARAGDHGKGFGVVATEVKSLSRQTADATETIRTQINQINTSFIDMLGAVSQSQSTMQVVVNKAERVANDFDQINTNSSSIADQVRELTDTISQQRIAVEQLAQNMTVIKNKGDLNTEAVNKLADQTDHSVAVIEAWRAQLANEDIDDKVIYLAQADHLLWKKRLLDMTTGRSNTKASDLTDHTLCRLGKWYYQQADARLKAMPAFATIETPHKNVHFHGIKAAECFEKGKIDEGMKHYRELEEASVAVITGLKSLIQSA